MRRKVGVLATASTTFTAALDVIGEAATAAAIASNALSFMAEGLRRSAYQDLVEGSMLSAEDLAAMDALAEKLRSR
jgi:hypothetical protein